MTASDPRHTFHELTVRDVVDETADTRSFVLDVPEALAELFAPKAGQFLTFQVPWADDLQLERSYSLSSAPQLAEALKVTVKRVVDGRVSNWFNDRVRPGDTLRVQPPAGRFVLRERDDDVPLTLWGGGSGITPLMSLLKATLRTTGRDVLLVYANRGRDAVIFSDELQAWLTCFPDRLRVVHHLDSDGGFVSEGAVRGWAADRLASDHYICGPAPFMDLVEKVLRDVGVAGDHLHLERFVSPVDPDRRADAPAPAPTPADAAGCRLTVTLHGEPHELDVEPGETLLDATLRAGLSPEYQCQDGYCACCIAKLREGAVDMAVNDALSEAEVDDGWILTCQARPKTPAVTIDFDAF